MFSIHRSIPKYLEAAWDAHSHLIAAKVLYSSQPGSLQLWALNLLVVSRE